METTYINVTPKWADLVHTLIELSANSRNAESKKVATDNLLKMAQAADLWNAAAPQLLAECLRAEGELCSALQVSSSEHMTVDMMRAWLKGVRSAIAKATGEQLSDL